MAYPNDWANAILGKKGAYTILGNGAIIRLRATTRDCPYEMGGMRFGGEWAYVAYPNDWANAIWEKWANAIFGEWR